MGFIPLPLAVLVSCIIPTSFLSIGSHFETLSLRDTWLDVLRMKLSSEVTEMMLKG